MSLAVDWVWQAQQAGQTSECEIVIGWDAVNAQTLIAAEPFRP